MGAGHGHRLHYHGHSRVHRAAAHHKILILIGFMFVVVATPSQWRWAFVGYLAALVVVIALSQVPFGYLAKRMVVEVPFVVFALTMPLIARGPRVDILGMSLSQSGLESAWNLLAKGTIGVIASLILAATTEPRQILAGLERLRMPRVLVEIMGFMIRYLDVVTDQMRRMLIAQRSRGFTARNPTHWPVLGKGLGALFIRSYERGERVHQAMLSRGYTGQMPVIDFGDAADQHRHGAHS